MVSDSWGKHCQADTFYLLVDPQGVTSAKTFSLTITKTGGTVDDTDYEFFIAFGSGASKEAADSDAGIATPTSIVAAHAVAFTGSAGAVYSPATPMSTNDDTVISMTLFIKPKASIAETGITTTLPPAFNGVTLQFLLTTL